MEELAESFGHPETYRELLKFYQVRNVSGALMLKRAQRLWELTGDSNDVTLWQAILRSFDPQARWRKAEKQWSPDLNFVQSVWRNAGKKNPDSPTQPDSPTTFKPRSKHDLDRDKN